MNKLKNKLRKWLGINDNRERIETIENLILHKESKALGFAILKKHLRTKDEKFYYEGKKI